MERYLFNKIMIVVCNHDSYFEQKNDAFGAMGLLPEQKITVVLRMLAYGASANQVDEIARMGKSTILQSPNEVLWSNRIYLHHRVPPATYSHGLGKASEESRDARFSWDDWEH
ncbi:hypothetical protein ACFX2A_047281 [Malus domestica]